MSNEEIIFSRLSAKYVQRADERQKAMGLQYTTAETHDLACFISDLIDDLDESCKHGFADWRNCATCVIREKMYAASVDRNPEGGDGTAPSRSDGRAVGKAETPTLYRPVSRD